MRAPISKIFEFEEEEISDCIPMNFINLEHGRYVSHTGVVLESENNMIFYKLGKNIESLGVLPKNKNSKIHSFNDQSIPYFVIFEKDGLHVYNKMMPNVLQFLYRIKFPPGFDVKTSAINDKYTLISNGELTYLFENKFGKFFSLDFLDSFYISASQILARPDHFLVNERYFIYPDKDVVITKEEGTLYYGDNFKIVRELKEIVLYRNGFNPVVVGNNFFELKDNQLGISGTDTDLILFDIRGTSRIFLEPGYKYHLYDNKLYVLRKQEFAIYNLSNKTNIINSMPKNIIRYRDPLKNNTFEHIISLDLLSERQKKLDNGQTPYYYPQVLFEDVE